MIKIMSKAKKTERTNFSKNTETNLEIENIISYLKIANYIAYIFIVILFYFNLDQQIQINELAGFLCETKQHPICGGINE